MIDTSRLEAIPLIAIGGSTGAPTALNAILKNIPKDFPAAILIAQHLDEVYAQGLVDVLDNVCALPVFGAADGSTIKASTILISQSNDHLIMDKMARLRYRLEPETQRYRPSVDELFASLALNWEGPLAAVLLSGMGNDGAKGLLALRRLGHLTIAQSQETCAVYGMPKAAAKINAAVDMLSPEKITERLLEWIGTIENY